MAGDWLQIDLDLPEKREVFDIAQKSGLDIDTVLGRLILFWRWVERHAKQSRVRNLSAVALARMIGGAESFWSALIECGWLAEENGDVIIPGFNHRFSKSAKRRILDAKRKKETRRQNVRKMSAARPHKSGPKEEKRREEKSMSLGVPKDTPLPPSLENDRFKVAWKSWLDCRREKRKPVTDRAKASQLKMLAGLDLDSAIEVIETSIRNDYTGLFPPKGTSNGKSSNASRVGPGQRYAGPDA